MIDRKSFRVWEKDKGKIKKQNRRLGDQPFEIPERTTSNRLVKMLEDVVAEKVIKSG